MYKIDEVLDVKSRLRSALTNAQEKAYKYGENILLHSQPTHRNYPEKIELDMPLMDRKNLAEFIRLKSEKYKKITRRVYDLHASSENRLVESLTRIDPNDLSNPSVDEQIINPQRLEELLDNMEKQGWTSNYVNKIVKQNEKRIISIPTHPL